MIFSRRKKGIAAILASIVLSFNFIACGDQGDDSVVTSISPKGTEITADEAIELLKDGNKRYVEGKTVTQDLSNERRNELFKDGQYPYAVVVSCSDSRVPTELIFDEGLGNIFVIRNAGNVIDPVTLGSVEYGAEHLGTPLIVVLGHQNCGAVKATVEEGHASENIEQIISLIKPAFEEAKSTTDNEEEVCTLTEDKNIENSIASIMESEVIKELVSENKVKVVGAKYSLEEGKVVFLDEN